MRRSSIAQPREYSRTMNTRRFENMLATSRSVYMHFIFIVTIFFIVLLSFFREPVRYSTRINGRTFLYSFFECIRWVSRRQMYNVEFLTVLRNNRFWGLNSMRLTGSEFLCFYRKFQCYEANLSLQRVLRVFLKKKHLRRNFIPLHVLYTIWYYLRLNECAIKCALGWTRHKQLFKTLQTLKSNSFLEDYHSFVTFAMFISDLFWIFEYPFRTWIN